MVTKGHKKAQSFSGTVKPCYHAPPGNLPPAIAEGKKKHSGSF